MIFEKWKNFVITFILGFQNCLCSEKVLYLMCCYMWISERLVLILIFINCREIMHAMWKPQKFKMIYLIATLYVLTLTLPSASAVYWAFGDMLLTHSNALSLLPRTGFRDSAVILMLIHQVNFIYHSLIKSFSLYMY